MAEPVTVVALNVPVRGPSRRRQRPSRRPVQRPAGSSDPRRSSMFIGFDWALMVATFISDVPQR
jgi:hypothetical protein